MINLILGASVSFHTVSLILTKTFRVHVPDAVVAEGAVDHPEDRLPQQDTTKTPAKDTGHRRKGRVEPRRTPQGWCTAT